MVRGWTRSLLLTALVLGTATPALAQANPFERYAHRVFDPDDGLPETLVSSIARTTDGYLWLGTRRGLARFDGVAFRLFSTDDAPGLGGDWINELLTDRAGRLWIGTTNGLAVLEGGAFRRIGPTAGLPQGAIAALYEDRAGALWVGSDSGLFVGRNGWFTRVDSIEATALGGDGPDGVLVGTARGLSRLVGGRMVRIASVGQVGAIAADDRGAWIGLRGGIRRLEIGQSVLGPLIAMGDRGELPSVEAIAIGADGRVWFGSPGGGVAVWDGRQVARFGVAQGLSSLEVTAILIDPRQRVWVGTGAALDAFKPSAFTTYSYREGFPHSLVWAVSGAPDGILFAAADNGGVYRFDGRRARPALPPVEADFGPSAMTRTAGGDLLVGRQQGRIFRVGDAGATELTATIGLSADLSINGLVETADRNLWIATDSGTYRWDGLRLESISRRHDLPPRLRVIVPDAGGVVWLARPGLYRLADGKVTHWGRAEGLTDGDVQALLPQGRNLWIGTADSGLHVLRDGKITAFGRIDRRLRSEVLGLIEDDYGFLWLTSSYGLLRVRRADLEAAADGDRAAIAIRRFDRLDGLPTTEFNGFYRNQAFKDPSGDLWLPSYVGLVRVDPERITADSAPPQVHLERLLVDGIEHPVGRRHRFAPGVGRLEVEFAATDALTPKRVRIQYRLLGAGDEWIEAGSRRAASFGPLEGGEYRFEVRASNEDGRWSPVNSAVEVEVAFRLYEQRWFLPVVMVTVLSGAAGVYGWRTRRVRRRALELGRLVRERTADLAAARDELERRVEERTAQLAAELAERKRLQHQLLQSQKLESIGRLAGGVAHEINNMMTGVLGFAEMAEAQAKDHPALLEDLRQITIAGNRVAQITRQLLTFARRQASMRSSIQVADLVGSLERFLLRIAGETVELVVAAESELPRIDADPSQLEQLIVNLVMNAKDAIGGQGKITLRLRTSLVAEVRRIGTFELLPGDYLVLEVSDTGSGISAEVQARLFEPFFTTKDVNRGSGLGLSVCYGIVSQHGGAIEVESELGRGSLFRVYLPVAAEVVEPAPPAAAEDRTPSGRERILVVEDEHAVRQVATRALEHLGYDVVSAGDGAEALEVLATGSVDLVLTDLVMPKMGGVELAQRLRDERPELPIVLMSGYAGRDAATSDLARLGPLLEKPFTRAALAEMIRRELDRAPAPSSRA